ncbi:MAG: AtpZ/AtpI family protein [Anaerolineales bacterium]|nr:MAG: AtpZ/AtpI family protein [Anaerolineales bacterium]
MGEAGRPPTPSSQPGSLALAIAGVLVQVGCLTVIVLLAALAGGLWLDTRFDTRPLFTLLIVLGSVPITVYMLFRLVLSGMNRLQQSNQPPEPHQAMGSEEAERGKNP